MKNMLSAGVLLSFLMGAGLAGEAPEEPPPMKGLPSDSRGMRELFDNADDQVRDAGRSMMAGYMASSMSSDAAAQRQIVKDLEEHFRRIDRIKDDKAREQAIGTLMRVLEGMRTDEGRGQLQQAFAAWSAEDPRGAGGFTRYLDWLTDSNGRGNHDAARPLNGPLSLLAAQMAAGQNPLNQAAALAGATELLRRTPHTRPAEGARLTIDEHESLSLALAGGAGLLALPSVPPRVQSFDFSSISPSQSSNPNSRYYWGSSADGTYGHWQLYQRGQDGAPDTHVGTVWQNGNGATFLNIHGGRFDETGVEVWGSVFAYNTSGHTRPDGSAQALLHGGNGWQSMRFETSPDGSRQVVLPKPSRTALVMPETLPGTGLQIAGGHVYRDGRLLSQHAVRGEFGPVRVLGSNIPVQAVQLDLAGAYAPYYLAANGSMLETAWRYNAGGQLTSFLRPRRNVVAWVPSPTGL